MPAQTSQSEINSVVWKACDTFRGTIDPSQYKDYILVLLFLKFLSDLTREKRAEYEQRYGGEPERVRRAMERERFLVPEGADFESLYAARSEPNIGERINKALERLEDANKAKLEAVFRNIDFNSEAALSAQGARSELLMLPGEAHANQLHGDAIEPTIAFLVDVLGDTR